MTKFACCNVVLPLSVAVEKCCLIGTSMSHNPFLLFRFPLRMASSFLYLQTKFLFFGATSLFSFKFTVHLSSQTCPKEMSNKLFKCGSVVAVLAATDRFYDIGNTPFLEGAIVSSSGRMTDSPL